MHEGAHALCAWALGAKRVRLGLLEGRWLSPRIEAELDETRPLRAALFFAAGPLGNGAAALALLALSSRSELPSAALVVAAALHALYGGLNALPFAAGSDGREVLARLFRRRG